MVARTRCKQRTHLGAAAPVALRRWRRPHVRGACRRRPLKGNRARPVGGTCGDASGISSPQAPTLTHRTASHVLATADRIEWTPRGGPAPAQRRQWHLVAGPGVQHVRVVWRRPRHRQEHALARAGAPALMAATPVAIRRTRPRGRTWHCASTAAATTITRTWCRQCTPPRHRGACSLRRRRRQHARVGRRWQPPQGQPCSPAWAPVAMVVTPAALRRPRRPHRRIARRRMPCRWPTASSGRRGGGPAPAQRRHWHLVADPGVNTCALYGDGRGIGGNTCSLEQVLARAVPPGSMTAPPVATWRTWPAGVHSTARRRRPPRQ